VADIIRVMQIRAKNKYSTRGNVRIISELTIVGALRQAVMGQPLVQEVSSTCMPSFELDVVSIN
jgi:hypothetical protein